MYDVAPTREGLVAVGHADGASSLDHDAAVWSSSDTDRWDQSDSASLGGPGDQRSVAVTEFSSDDPRRRRPRRRGLGRLGPGHLVVDHRWGEMDPFELAGSGGGRGYDPRFRGLRFDAPRRRSDGSPQHAGRGRVEVDRWSELDDGRRRGSCGFGRPTDLVGAQRRWPAHRGRVHDRGRIVRRGGLDLEGRSRLGARRPRDVRRDRGAADEGRRRRHRRDAVGRRRLPGRHLQVRPGRRTPTQRSGSRRTAETWEKIGLERVGVVGVGIQTMFGLTRQGETFVASGSATANTGDLDAAVWTSTDGRSWNPRLHPRFLIDDLGGPPGRPGDQGPDAVPPPESVVRRRRRHRGRQRPRQRGLGRDVIPVSANLYSAR